MLLAINLYLLILISSCKATCPIWSSYNTTTQACLCGSSLGGLVDCINSPHLVSVLYCYCMTYNENIDQFTVGQCPYNCYFTRTGRVCIDKNLVIYSNASSDLNNVMVCSHLNRDGHLCGDCLKGYGTPVYSYSLKCEQCDEEHFKLNLLKYIIFGYFPLTIFYTVVITFKISLTSHQMIAYVFACQVLTLPSMVTVIISLHKNNVWIDITLVMTSIWNLDFFRSVYTPFCLHPKLNAMHVIALDYIVAVYPMFLIAITYIAVALHDRYPLVVSIWRPVQKIVTCIRKEWDIRGSLVRGFSTFLSLSYVKILNVSFELLSPVYPLDVYRHYINQTYLYSAGSVEYFGYEHLPFGILAIVMMITFNILPVLLLIFYPYNWFRKFLLCGRHSTPLHTFMESFNGYYRSKPRYYQSFAAAFFISRFIQLLLFSKYRSISFIFYSTFHLMILSLVYSFFQPHKSKFWNNVNFIILVITGLTFLTLNYHVYSRSYEPAIYGNHLLYDIIVIVTTQFYGYLVVSLLTLLIFFPSH